MTKAEYYVEYRKNNKEKLAAYHREYRKINKEKMSAYHKKRYIADKDRVSVRNKKWRENNKEQSKQYQRDYVREKRQEDPMFRMASSMRRNIATAFKRKSLTKTSKTKDILGVESWDFFMGHLSKTFENNYGEKYNPDTHKVHIDHIVPISTAKNEGDLIKLNHHSNLQLLKAKDNLKKSDKLDWSMNDNL